MSSPPTARETPSAAGSTDAQVVDLRELGQRIRQFRLEKRLTLKQVEERSSLSATHLSEIERGRTSPTIGALTRIARALDKEPSYFIEFEPLGEVSHVPRDAARSFAAAQGVTAETMTSGISGGEIFSYRLTFSPETHAELVVPHREAPAEALYLVRRGTIEVEFGGCAERLGPGDAAHGCIGADHLLRCEAGGAEVIAVLTRPLDSGD